MTVTACTHLRPHTTPGLNGCRVKGVCTPIECLYCESHTERSHSAGIVKLLRKPQIIGENYHRSGWPFAMESLLPIHSSTAPLVLDDFVEQTWIYSQRREPITQPWAGIFHHPPHPPAWTRRQDRIDLLCDRPEFAESLKHLRLAICLSQYLADWISDHWQVSTAVVKHPTEIPAMTWQPDEWLSQPRLLQCGWYLRNVRLIHQIDTPHHKTRLMPQQPHHLQHEAACMAAFADRREYPAANLLDLNYIENSGYDWLLSRSVVCMEVLDAAANNVTIECLARNTPLIVNRHPAVVEYLGADYPLYFDDYRQIGGMLNDEALILSAHRYLEAADKSFLNRDHFASGIRAAVESVQ